MNMIRGTFVLFSLVLCAVFANPAGYENLSIIKTVDLSDPIIKVTLRIAVRGSGDITSKYEVAISKAEFEHLSFIEATTSKKIGLPIKKERVDDENGVVLYSIGSEGLKDDRTVIIVNYYLTQVLTPLPAMVHQKDVPKFVYETMVLYPSPYPTKSMETRFKLPTNKYESATPDEQMVVKDDVISYGPYEHIKPYANEKSVVIHFSSVARFITFDKVEREIEISHWGNIAFEEVVHARNSGAPLTGEFSRLDYYKSDPDDIPAWESVNARIDKRATDIYYRDIIGNITTSNVRKEVDAVNVDLTMRFPMMGGWKTEFYWGYNLPSGRVLKKQGTRFSLTIPYSTPLRNADIRELSVRIVLPECVKNVRFVLPEGVEQPSLDYRYTYLDSGMEGRPVYEFKMANLIDLHNTETITVSYDLNPMMLWREPLMCISAFFIVFLIKAVVKKLAAVPKEKSE